MRIVPRSPAIDTTNYRLSSIIILPTSILVDSNANTHLGVVGGLGTATAASSATTATVLATEIATVVTLATVAVALEPASATGSAVAAASAEAGATIVAGSLGATRLNDNILAIHGVRVARHSSLVSLKRLILDECAVL